MRETNLSFVQYTGDGTTRAFAFTVQGEDIGYFRTTDIHGYVDGEEVPILIHPSTPHMMQFYTAPARGSAILIRREMPFNRTYADFERGNNFGKRQVNNSFLQQLYLTQQLMDGFLPEGFYLKDDLDMGGHRIINLGKPRDNSDAVRLIDLKGGIKTPKGVAFLGGMTYIRLATALVSPDTEAETTVMTYNANFMPSAGRRAMLMSEAGDVVFLSADLKELTLRDKDGNAADFDISMVDLPLEAQVAFKVIFKRENGKLYVSILHGTNQSGYFTVGSFAGGFTKMFGGEDEDSPSRIIIYNQNYFYKGITNAWDYYNQTGINVQATYVEFTGTIIGQDWEAVDEDDGLIDLTVTAPKVKFDPYGTGFSQQSTDVDKVLREADQTFIRTDFIVEQPDFPDGTVLSPYRTWLANTQDAPRFRPLPADPANGVEIRVRDNSGHATTNNISIGGNGKTIMGLDEDLNMTVSWSWCTLKYFKDIDDWRVVEGGVGVQVRAAPSEEMQRMYPVGQVLLTMNPANPADYLGFGAWSRSARGLVLVGAGTGRDIEGNEKQFALGANAGKYQHMIEMEQMPEHVHEINNHIRYTNPDNEYAEKYHIEDGGQNWPDIKSKTLPAGGHKPLDHFYPTFGVIIWTRVA